MPRHLESTIKLILEDNIKNHFKRKLSLYLSLYFALFEFPFILCWTWLHEPVSGDGAKLCYYSSRCLTFARRRLKNRIVFIQIICSTLWLLQVQSSGLPSIFLTAQPQPTFYLISKTFLGMLHAKETGITSGRLGLWLVCAFTFLILPLWDFHFAYTVLTELRWTVCGEIF